MARFIRIAVTDINGDGEPLPSDRDEWLNVDHVTSVRGMLSNNLARRHRLHGAIPREFYPLLELRTADRRARLISLGTYPDAPTAMAALHAFTPVITAPAGVDLDAELAALVRIRAAGQPRAT